MRFWPSPIAFAWCFALIGADRGLAWTSPINVTNMPAGSRAFGPRLAADSGGQLHLVWAGGVDPSSSWQAWYQACTGGAWGSPSALSGANANRPDIAVDGNNNLHVCYEDDAERDLWYRKRTGASWGSPVNLMTGGRSIASHIAADSAGGKIMVAWHEDHQVGDEWDIFTKLFSGGGWTGPQNISSDGGLSSNARVAIDSAGAFHVLWQSDGQEVYCRKRNADGNWAVKTRLDHTGERSAIGDIVVSADNLVHVVYSEDDGAGGWEVFYRYFNGSNWSSPVNISNHGGPTDDVGASLACDAFGRVYAVWHDYSNIYFASSPGAGGAWSSRQTVVGGAYVASEPDIAVHGNTSHVVWQSRPSSSDNWNIYHSQQTNPAPPPSGTLAGVVRDQYGAGVIGASISVDGVPVGISGAGGSYSVPVAVGTHQATATKNYYSPQTVPNVTIVQDQTTVLDFAIAGQPPGPVPVFTVSEQNQRNRLSWTNPTSGNFTGTMIRFSTTSYPATPASGTLLLDRAGVPGGAEQFAHENLSNGTPYYYAAFAYFADASRHYAAGATAVGRPGGPGDCNHDGDVDQEDFGAFQLCLSGAYTPYPAGCEWANFDGDVDVDGEDLAVFAGCMSGADVAADPGCAD